MKNAMVHALQTVDKNHASHDQIIQAQAQYLQRLTAKQDALTNAMQALSDANVRLNESMLAQERVEEQRRQIVQLEAIPRMTKVELNTPDKDVDRRLFHEPGQSSQSHSQNDPPGEFSTPPNSHSQNDKGGTDCAALEETVRRLRFWILQITGALDIEEDPGNVSFPNPRTCRELNKLKKEVEALMRYQVNS